jgi:parallel beta-helix repeat protein
MRGSQYLSVTGNTIRNCYSVGIKVVNGASYNTISGNTISEAGLAGIWLVPGATAVEDRTIVRGNVIANNTVVNTGAGFGEKVWFVPGGRRPVGVTIEFGTTPSTRPTGNLVVGNVVTNDAAHPTLNYGISDLGAGTDPREYPAVGNTFSGNLATGAQIQDVRIRQKGNRLAR